MTTLTDDDLTTLLTDLAAGYDVPEDGPQQVLAALAAPAPVVPLRRRRWAQGVAAAAAVAAAFAGGALLDGRATGGAAETQVTAAPPTRDFEESQTGPEGQARDEDLAYNPDSGTLDQREETLYSAGSDSARSAGASVLEQAPVGGVAVRTPNARPAAPVPAAPAPAAAPPGAQAPAPDGARVIKNGSIALIVADGRVTPTLTAVQQLATENGGVVSSGETQESGTTPSGTVTLRVPVDRFEQVVAGVRGLDAEVRTATTSGRDVTAEYTDVEAQLRTLRAARERFLEVLRGARTIGDILTVQQRVDDVTGQIDRLEGQRALLEAQSDMATLAVSVTEADDPVVRMEEQPDGLSKAFRDAWGGFTSGVEAIVAASGRAVLVLLCGVLLALVLRLAWRLSRRRLV